MRRASIVFVGGGIGASLRGALLAWFAPPATGLPVPVLLINVLGAVALGTIYVLADEAGVVRAETRLFVAVGVLGGFTTFSTFGWGTDLLVGRGSEGAALGLIYIGASVIGGAAGILLGLVAGRAFMRALGHQAEGGRQGERDIQRPGAAHRRTGPGAADDTRD